MRTEQHDMSSDTEMIIRDEARRNRFRLRIYLVLSGVAASILAMFLIPVPLIPAHGVLWMLSISGTLLIAAIGTGFWRLKSADAPATVWPVGPVVAVINIIELAICIWGFFEMVFKMRR